MAHDNRLRGASWRTSSRSTGGGQNCVEVALTSSHVGVRDSKDQQGPALAFGNAAWAGFITALKADIFDR